MKIQHRVDERSPKSQLGISLENKKNKGSRVYSKEFQHESHRGWIFPSMSPQTVDIPPLNCVCLEMKMMIYTTNAT